MAQQQIRGNTKIGQPKSARLNMKAGSLSCRAWWAMRRMQRFTKTELLCTVATAQDKSASGQIGAYLRALTAAGILTVEEIIKCCDLYGAAGVDFMKTSTGYAEKGATVEAVQLMRKHLANNIRIKASGGIKTYTFAKQLVDAGADRLGCSSSITIVNEAAGHN